MKDSTTVLPMVNGDGNDENKNNFHYKNKKQENKINDERSMTTLKNELDNEELVGGCCVCSDDQGFPNNALVYCDGKDCTVACHTACYGIVSIPDGDWYCGRCDAGDIRAPCRLCPIVEGAMKRTSDGGWAHVVCALYIPEVSFGDNATMEPIILSKIPATRYGEECSICVQNGRSKTIATSGACCRCTVKNCSQVFHVTCAQTNGLLCEDVRKNNCQYPIYCEQHRPKFSKFIRQISAFQYSPNALASIEQLKRQHFILKEKESPSQLSDFVAAAAAEAAAAGENNLSSSTFNEINNQTTTSDEQQTPVTRAFYAADILKRKSSSNTNSSFSSTSTSSPVQQKCHSRSSSSSSSSNSSLQKKMKLNNNSTLNDLSQFVQLNKEERTSSCQLNNQDKTTKLACSIVDTKKTTTDSSNISNESLDHQSSLSSIEEKPLATRCITSSSNTPMNNKASIKERYSTDPLSTNVKLTSLKKSMNTKFKDELNKKRKISIKLNKNGQIRKKYQHSIDRASRSASRLSSASKKIQQQLTNDVKHSSLNYLKQQKTNDRLVNTKQISSDNENNLEMKLHTQTMHYSLCDHFGNQINSDVLKQHEHSDEQIDLNEATSSHRTSSATVSRVDFFPRRPLQNTLMSSTITDQQQRTFPPQTLEEFLEQEWELSSDFLLQQPMPHDVSSLLSCLYQFKSENASLQKKFDELIHRRDSLRVTNANLRRRLSEILPINSTVSSIPTTTTATISQVSPSTTLSTIPPSPRKEQQQLKQQKLLAELELQQQLQQQKTISPMRRRLPTNTNNRDTDSCQQTTKKTKSPRQSNSLMNHSLLENQLRQSNPNLNSTKKLNVSTNLNNKKVTSSVDVELISHPQSAIKTSTTTSPSSYNQINNVTAAAAAALTLAKNGRTTSNSTLNLELLSQILTTPETSTNTQPTWNHISNLAYANFPAVNRMSISDESVLCSTAQLSLEQQPSTK